MAHLHQIWEVLEALGVELDWVEAWPELRGTPVAVRRYAVLSLVHPANLMIWGCFRGFLVLLVRI
jgi:hypothetical protein